MDYSNPYADMLARKACQNKRGNMNRLIFPFVVFLEVFILTLNGFGHPTDNLTDKVTGDTYRFSISGLFSLFNVVIFLGATGVTISLLPALLNVIQIFKCDAPLKILIECGDILGYIGAGLLFYIGVPTPDAMGALHPTTTGYWLSLLGAGLTVVSFLATLAHLPSNGGLNDAVIALHVLAFGILTPLTLAFRSALMGFLAITALMGVFGFSGSCSNLCWAFGFNDKGAVQRSALASTFIIGVYNVLRFVGVAPEYLIPFSTGVNVMGNTVLLIALLIISSRYYSSDDVYILHQFYLLVAITTNVFVGYLYNIPSLRYTGLVFTGLYLSSKVGEYIRFFGRHAWLWMFLFSGGMFCCGLYLKDHPDVVTGLLIRV